MAHVFPCVVVPQVIHVFGHVIAYEHIRKLGYELIHGAILAIEHDVNKEIHRALTDLVRVAFLAVRNITRVEVGAVFVTPDMIYRVAVIASVVCNVIHPFERRMTPCRIIVHQLRQGLHPCL